MYRNRCKKILAMITCLLMTYMASFAGNGDRVKTSDGFLSPSAVSVKGLLGASVSLSERGRLRSLPQWNNGSLITMFSPGARAKNNSTDWYGEHAGKWLYTASLAVNRTSDDSLRSLLIKTADYLVANQEADGYMGSYSPELRITNKNSKQHKKSWDTWSLGCMMLGLVQLHREIADDKYLTAAKKIGDLLLNTFGEGAANITDYGTRYGYSATVVLEPVVELYKETNDKRYLDFAQLIVKQVEQREGLKLIAAALNNRDMETVADGKAYQVIWNITGLAKLYEVTGNPDYLKAVENAWQNIRDYHLTVTGGPWGGIGKHKECFNAKNYWDPAGFIETCSTMSWIQLNKFLLHLTGDAKYAQETEKSAYNALLGAQFSNGQDWTYHSFTNGRRFAANFNDCCPSSGVMALEELSPMVYSLRQNGIACNLYGPNDAAILLGANNKVHISQQTSYPYGGNIRMVIRASQKSSFPLFVRIPDWVQQAAITVNGVAVSTSDIKSGTYYTINREWEKETVVDISFPMSLRVMQQAEYATMPQGTADLYRVKWFAVARGPLVYASDGLVDGKDRERNFSIDPGQISKAFVPLDNGDDKKAPSYTFRPHDAQPLVFRPFYEAGGREQGKWRLTWFQNEVD